MADIFQEDFKDFIKALNDQQVSTYWLVASQSSFMDMQE